MGEKNFYGTTKKSLLVTVDAWSGKQALVVGDVMLDVEEHCRAGNSKELASEAPGVLAFQVNAVIKKPGGAGNIAANLRAMGADVKIFGVIGKDSAGEDIVSLSRPLTPGFFFVFDTDRPTTVKRRMFMDGKYILRYDIEKEDDISEYLQEELFSRFKSSMRSADVVVLSDYAKGTLPERLIINIVSLARKYNKPIVGDPKPRSILAYKGVDLLTPNIGEMKEICRSLGVSECRVPDVLECHVAVTRGEKSAILYGENFFSFVKVDKKVPVSRVGAGDTFTAAAALSLSAGAEMEDAVFLGNIAGGIVVTKPGTATVSKKEIEEYISNL